MGAAATPDVFELLSGQRSILGGLSRYRRLLSTQEFRWRAMLVARLCSLVDESSEGHGE
jgi:hypothetical protein